ncbi:MAG: efflux RND transporter permease subunit, partial [Pseudomonadota bacterium]
MNISKFFVDRPIFAGVLSIIILVGGLISMMNLPISEYPEVVPPSVIVKAQFPGANPQTIAETVATPIEEQINGVEGMLYMASQATSDGLMTLTVTFKLGTPPDLAQQLVQNRVNQALPRLPEEVQRLGVTTVKSSPDLTMVVHLLSPNHRYDMTYLRNYALLNVKDRLARLEGVGQVQLFGSGDYSMRIWLDPRKVAERKLAASDVVKAIREQNVDVAAGVIGASPSLPGVDYQISVNANGRLINEEEFRNIVIRTSPEGVVTRLSDVARVEMGASEYALRSLLDNKSAVAIPIFQSPGSNALQISENVRKTMAELQKDMPEGVEYHIVYDPTQFVRSSIHAVIETLLIAVALVVLVVIVFLQTWRASIIPLLAVPVSIIGTFAIMMGLGFSINTLSLFGLVLAIGIVVDDAIVVVENVERNIEDGLSPKEATYKAMREVSGPIVAIALTLAAVFVPLAFVSGLTGQFFKQFALTIAISTVISAFNSLTLSPALASLLLKKHGAKKDAFQRGIDKLFGWFFVRFNRMFKRGSTSYSNGVTGVLQRKSIMLAIYAVLIAGTLFLFHKVPAGFIPAQDKQYLVSFAQLPDAASLDRTEDVIRQMSDIALKHPGVESAVAFPGLSINGFTNSPNSGIVFVTLKPFDERKTAELNGFTIAQQLNKDYASIQGAFIAVFPPPPVQGLGTIGGFKLQIQDRAALGNQELNSGLQAFMAKAQKAPELAGMFSSYQINVPQLYADVDRTHAQQLGVSIPDVFETLQIYLGSLYVNDFNKFGRTYQVRVQADAQFRAHAEDIGLLKARNDKGDMVPLSSLLKMTQSYGPDRAMRYNGYPAADINGGAAPGFSTGEAQAAVERIAAETLPRGMGYEWTELTYQEKIAGNTLFVILPLSVMLVFL